MARTNTRSPWRLHARYVINLALSRLPKDATPEQIKAAVSGAYPFCERHGWPYKQFLIEARLALVSKPRRKETAEQVLVVLDRRPDGRPWVEVRCGWCGDRMEWVSINGIEMNKEKRSVPCMMCLAAHRQVERIVALDGWRKLRRAAKKDGGIPTGVLLDWLKDQGVEAEEAASVEVT